MNMLPERESAISLLGAAMVCVLGLRVLGAGEAVDTPPVAERVLTNIYEMWELPVAEKTQPHRMKTEVVIYFFDHEWNNAWGECQGRPAYLPIADCPVPLFAGQRVSFDGLVVPIREKFLWDKTTVKVLESDVPRHATPVHDLGANPADMKGQLILTEGLVDRVLLDQSHISIRLLVGDIVGNAYVLRDTNTPLQDIQVGDIVRLKCVYSPQFDRDGNISDLSLFVGRQADAEVVGSLKTEPRFQNPVIPIGSIQEDSPTGSVLHVEGIVQTHEPGKWVTIWDTSGQVMIQSRQEQPLRFGDRIDAMGYPVVVGVQACLRAGVYRISTSTNPIDLSVGSITEKAPLRLAARIRDLTPQEADRRLPVELRGILIWSHHDTPFAYVQDASGGIRVANPRIQGNEVLPAGTIVVVRGQAAEGPFVPMVTNAVLSHVGWRNLDTAQRVTLEEALTGVHDGRWVEMRGLVRDVRQIQGLVRLELSTSSGEFEAFTPAAQTFENLRGSIIRVQGVCAAASNKRHQLTGIQVWSPEAKYIQVEEQAPGDLFAVPFRSLDSLRRFNSRNALNQRVRTFGTVVLHSPGAFLYAQDGTESVLALSRQEDALHTGDRVEIVGFPGNEGRRFVLREAVYRKISSGEEPSPLQLSAVQSLDPDLDGLLAKAEGTLLNRVSKEAEERLLIHTTDATFEASLSCAPGGAVARIPLKIGSRLALVGVYQVQRDEDGNPRSFLLRLRSWNDVRVLQQPPWWTLARLLWVLVAVLAVFLIAVSWGVMLSRKNRLLRLAQADLQAANDKLELRVEERTHELRERTEQLQEQVIAKERAREELADAQKRLILASRQAGMAEVATGVLHNVGNVLNSVNVSVCVVKDKVAQLGAGSLNKVLTLLHEHEHDLGHFLQSDAKGKQLVSYLELVNERWGNDRAKVGEELDALARNVEHIKEIVSVQQSHAQTSGVLEVLQLTEIIEEAIRMHEAGYQRHSVEVTRDFCNIPAVTVDRHKVLQILTNLLHNAKYACDQKDASNRHVKICLTRPVQDRVRIEVSDNGMGIPPENLTRIFSFGFTTRPDGHGFGLHSGALAAKEMGGSLTASSDGPGKGARFVLDLPLGSAS